MRSLTEQKFNWKWDLSGHRAAPFADQLSFLDLREMPDI